MKVKVGDKIYDSKEQPIMVIFSEEDKENISNMNPDCTKYCSHPENMEESDTKKWMEEKNIGTFKYVLTGNGNKALAIHSSLNLLELREYIQEHSIKVHPESYEVVYRIGIMEFVNPIVHILSDYGNFCPYLIEVN